MVLQGKQIQQHLKPNALQHICIVKLLGAGLVVHDPHIGNPVAPIDIHAVDKAGDGSVTLGAVHHDRRHLPLL